MVSSLAAFFGTDEIATSIDSSVTKTARSFARFSDLLREVNEARILGGLHYRFSMAAGEELGEKAARVVARRFGDHERAEGEAGQIAACERKRE